jgi:hypothetical protein
LFWNTSDSALKDWLKNSNTKNSKLNKYIEDSQPKIGWDNHANINHFDLVKLLYHSEIMLNKLEIRTFFDNSSLENAVNMIKKSDISSLLTDFRLELIEECLALRFQKLRDITHA